MRRLFVPAALFLVTAIVGGAFSQTGDGVTRFHSRPASHDATSFAWDDNMFANPCCRCRGRRPMYRSTSRSCRAEGRDRCDAEYRSHDVPDHRTGKPFTLAGFGNHFRVLCDTAGFPRTARHTASVRWPRPIWRNTAPPITS
jgi:hypothetical protein